MAGLSPAPNPNSQWVPYAPTADGQMQTMTVRNAGTTEKVNCWPRPEVPNNIDMTVGNLGLTDHEEDLIVTFMQTLTDGYTRPFPDANTFTGGCMNGGSASTQGNEFLIQTPPLPACSPEIRGVAPLPGPQPIP
jgi:cytochrome c peroxidase